MATFLISGCRLIISLGGYQSGHSCLFLIVATPDQPKPSRPTPTPKRSARPFGTWQRQVDAAKSGGPPLSYSKLVDDYLNEAHRDNLGTGCAFGTLSGEIARSDKQTRALASDEIRNNLQLIAGLLPGKDKRAARSKSILTYSALVGAMSLARAVSGEALSLEILKTVAEVLKKPVS